jgi:biopolymer transport protein ExbD
MKVRNVGRHADEKVELMMTPMIDIVFQLLIFFIMTFKIISPEGDFNIRMPIAAQEGTPDMAQLPPLKVRLVCGEGGRLTAIRLGDRPIKDFRDLHMQIRQIVGDQRGPGSVAETTEVELDCDYDLRFESVIDAISAVSGYIADDGRSIVKLIEKIKFAPARGGPPAST